MANVWEKLFQFWREIWICVLVILIQLYFRSSIVNNRTQAVVCDDLGITEYALFAVPKKDLKVKDRADLLEAFLGALYVDKDLEYCQVFAAVCFFPR